MLLPMIIGSVVVVLLALRLVHAGRFLRWLVDRWYPTHLSPYAESVIESVSAARDFAEGRYDRLVMEFNASELARQKAVDHALTMQLEVGRLKLESFKLAADSVTTADVLRAQVVDLVCERDKTKAATGGLMLNLASAYADLAQAREDLSDLQDVNVTIRNTKHATVGKRRVKYGSVEHHIQPPKSLNTKARKRR